MLIFDLDSLPCITHIVTDHFLGIYHSCRMGYIIGSSKRILVLCLPFLSSSKIQVCRLLSFETKTIRNLSKTPVPLVLRNLWTTLQNLNLEIQSLKQIDEILSVSFLNSVNLCRDFLSVKIVFRLSCQPFSTIPNLLKLKTTPFNGIHTKAIKI